MMQDISSGHSDPEGAPEYRTCHLKGASLQSGFVLRFMLYFSSWRSSIDTMVAAVFGD